MSRLSKLALILAAVTLLISACWSDQTASVIPSEEAVTPNDSVQTEDLDWETYLATRGNHRNLLDIKVPSQYTISLEFDPEAKGYTGAQTVKYVNNEDVPLKELYFHIYPNAFQAKDTTPYSPNSYAGGFKPGSITISKVLVGNTVVQPSVLGADNTLLKIPLEQSLPCGQIVEIYMEFEVILPPALERFGYGENTFQIGNGYPVAAVYDSNGWNLEPYHSMGDPFYSDVSNYHVTIKAPKDYIIACSGKIVSEMTVEGDKVWRIKAERMRDFAWAASDKFIILEKDIGGILVKNYLLPNNSLVNSEAAELAYKSVEVFNRIFGQYPYEVLSVVTADTTGMEYPGMVFVWKSARLNDRNLESTIIHEIAHQWWYGAVGNNQVDEAWLDESFAIYAQKLFYDEVYGEVSGAEYYNQRIVHNYNERRSGDEGRELVLTPSYMFSQWNHYTALLHKGSMFLHSIDAACGKSKFYSILNTYYQRFMFTNATTQDFIEVCEELSGEDYEEEVNKWLFDN